MRKLIQEYNIEWSENFNKIALVLATSIKGTNIRIEHVGSTSVPGLAAKNIIDIDVVYHEPEDFDTIKSDLEKMGYYHNGDQGILGREVFKRNVNIDFQHGILDEVKHHLYVCHKDNSELKRHIQFRDYLRRNEEARNQYAALKIEIAERAEQDKKTYNRLKEEMASRFIEEIIRLNIT